MPNRETIRGGARRLSFFVAAGLVASAASFSVAAPNPEITVIPLGNATIKKGVQEMSFRLSSASQNQMIQPLVIIAAQPQLAASQPADDSGDPPPPGPQVPATVSIEVGGKALPDWVLSPRPTAYVINADTIRSNPEFASARLLAKVHLKSDAQSLGVVVLGMPDPLLLDQPDATAKDGPLVDFQRSARDPEIRDYFQSMIDEFSGHQDDAFKTLQKLCKAQNPEVARFARRSTRRIGYLRRETKLSGNFLEHYRWGLYLEFCGLYRPAYDEFEECRVINPDFADTQYRAGECFEIIGSDLMGVLQYMDRCEQASSKTNTSRLDMLAVIIRSDGKTNLTDTDVLQLMDHLTITEKMIAAATGNALDLEFSWQIINHEEDLKLVKYPGDVMGPTADKFDREGWFDGVITIRPASPDVSGADLKVSPVGAGPKHMTVASANSNARWSDFLDAVYQMVVDGGQRAGTTTTLPPAKDAVTAGIGPSPHIGFSCRSALRYAAARDDFAGIGITELPLEASFLTAWRIDSPSASSGVDKGRFAGLAVADGTQGTAKVFDSSTIPLTSKGGTSGQTRATCWVYVPSDQLTQLRIDQLGPIGVRVNGCVVREGESPREAKGADWYSTFVGIRLSRGWNTLELVTPSGEGGSPSFKASLLTPEGKPIGGLAMLDSRPDENVVAIDDGRTDGSITFKWDDVRDDWHRMLPVVDVAKATGIRDARLVSNVGDRTGYIAVDIPGRPASSRYRAVPKEWKQNQDRDVVFNNLLDWYREWCFIVGSKANGKQRQLLFARPEAVDAIVQCLKEDDSAKQRFGEASAGSRVLGRIEVPGVGCRHDLIVFDVWLGDESKWPIEEEDLISPFGKFVPNDTFMGPVSPAGPMSPGASLLPTPTTQPG